MPSVKDDLPELPEPMYWAEEHGTGKNGRRGIYRPQQAKASGQDEFFFVYTADQMQSYARLAVQQAVGWRPIETAPRDGTEVDLWTEYGRETYCRYEQGLWVNVEDGMTCSVTDPTHWMPPPKPPERNP